jgi:hypothetical protein
MLEPNFHSNTIVYVDNADMSDAKAFLNTISKDETYQLQYGFEGKIAIITK